MKSITLYDGRTCEIDNCIGCDVYDGRIDMSESIVYENEYFRIVQDTETPIVGFFVISSKRHVRTLNELTEEEYANMCTLLKHTRRNMEDVLGIQRVTLIQEDGRDGKHFHPWFFPWYEWMDDLELEGPETSRVRAIMAHSCEHMRTHENLKNIQGTVEAMRATYTGMQ